jgi:hypothetical protein
MSARNQPTTPLEAALAIIDRRDATIVALKREFNDLRDVYDAQELFTHWEIEA